MWPAQRPVVGVEAGRRPVGRPAIAQPAGPPVLFRRQFGTCSLGATGRASAPRGLRQGKANVRKDTERSVAAERSRHSRRSLPTLLHCRRSSSEPKAAALEQQGQPRSGRARGCCSTGHCRRRRLSRLADSVAASKRLADPRRHPRPLAEGSDRRRQANDRAVRAARSQSPNPGRRLTSGRHDCSRARACADLAIAMATYMRSMSSRPVVVGV